ncbi:ABC transporter permease [bacterium]|nr:ABC transporter permease [bacterium]
MRNILKIVKREIFSMITTSGTYVVAGLFLLLTGWYFSSSLLVRNRADLDSVFSIIPFLFMFFIPAITMKLIAEEKKNGIMEQMLTFPVSDVQYVIGKFLSAFIFIAALLLFTLFYYITIEIIGEPDTGKIIASYISALFLGGALISIGLFASSQSSDQITSYIVSFSIIFVLYLADKVVNVIPFEIQNVVLYLGTDTHYRNMLRGVIDSRDIVYFISIILLFLFLTARNLEKRKW